jgi:hypothetical protein
MKHALGCLIVLCLAAGSAAAQGLQPGVKGGVNLANVSNVSGEGGDGSPGFDARVGLVAGVFATWRPISWLELQPEVLVTSKGAALADEGIDARLVLDYLEVPLLARVSRRVSGATVYAAAGPTVAWLLRAKTRIAFDGSTEEIDMKEDVEPFDIGVAMGGGVEIGAFVIDGRYTLGLSDIDADRGDAITIRNRVISLTAGFRF